MNNKKIHMAAFLLLVIGGLNWLLLGVFQWEIGALFGGSEAIISRLIYVLIGLAAVYEIATHKGNCRSCETKGSAESTGSAASQSPTV